MQVKPTRRLSWIFSLITVAAFGGQAQARTVTFGAGFTSSQVNQLTAALSAAFDMADESRATLLNTPAANRATAPRYLERGLLVADYDAFAANFDKLWNALYGFDIQFVVGTAAQCADDTKAQHEGMGHKIEVCAAFFNLATTRPYGFSSQAGCLLHEVTHFGDVLGTSDSTPSDPHNNLSYSYVYQRFAENDPWLPMSTKPLVQSLYVPVKIPAYGTVTATVNCSSKSVVTGGGWDKVTDGSYVFSSKMVGNGWEVQIANATGFVRNGHVGANCLYNQKGKVSQVMEAVTLTTTKPLYNSMIGCPADPSGNLPVAAGFSFVDTSNAPSSYAKLIKSSVLGTIVKRMGGTKDIKLTQYLVCLKGSGASQNTVFAGDKGAYNTSQGVAVLWCPSTAVMTSAGFLLGTTTSNDWIQANELWQSRSTVDQYYQAVLKPRMSAGADTTKIDIYAPCLTFP